LGLVEENYPFISLDVGAVEKSSYSHGFKNSDPGRKLELYQLGAVGCCPVMTMENECHCDSE
jgi:hypothetical protein